MTRGAVGLGDGVICRRVTSVVGGCVGGSAVVVCVMPCICGVVNCATIYGDMGSIVGVGVVGCCGDYDVIASAIYVVVNVVVVGVGDVAGVVVLCVVVLVLLLLLAMPMLPLLVFFVYATCVIYGVVSCDVYVDSVCVVGICRYVAMYGVAVVQYCIICCVHAQ